MLVPVDTLLYGGLEFAFGADPLRFPFARLRTAGMPGARPKLATAEREPG